MRDLNWTKIFWNAAGTLFLGLGLAGIALPIMPGFVFVLISAFCFARGSRRFLRFLMRFRFRGETFNRFRKRPMVSKGLPISLVLSLAATVLTIIILAR